MNQLPAKLLMNSIGSQNGLDHANMKYSKPRICAILKHKSAAARSNSTGIFLDVLCKASSRTMASVVRALTSHLRNGSLCNRSVSQSPLKPSPCIDGRPKHFTVPRSQHIPSAKLNACHVFAKGWRQNFASSPNVKVELHLLQRLLL